MARTVEDLINQGLRLIAAVQSASGMSAAEKLTNLQSLNLMCNNWALDARILPTFTEIAAVTDDSPFTSGAELAVVYNWAIFIAPEYNRSVPAEVVKIAEDSLNELKLSNATHPAPAKFDLFGMGDTEIYPR